MVGGMSVPFSAPDRPAPAYGSPAPAMDPDPPLFPVGLSGGVELELISNIVNGMVTICR